MVSGRSGINVADYTSEAFTDAIYELVKNEAIRLHESEGLEIVLAGRVAAYIATLPIVAMAAGGKQGVQVELIDLCDKFFKDINEVGNKHE